MISPTTSATDINPQLSSSDCARQYLVDADESPYTPLAASGAATDDDEDGGLPDVLLPAVVDDAACVAGAADSLPEPHAATRQTLEKPMKARTAAVPAVLANREFTMALIEPLNH